MLRRSRLRDVEDGRRTHAPGARSEGPGARCAIRRSVRPSHAFFDLNGTLLDPAPLAEPLAPGVDRDRFVETVLTDAVLLGAVETITGSFRDFADLLRIAAARRLRRIGAEGALDAVLAAAGRMRPFADAREAIETLRGAGIGAGVLTNSSGATARSLLGDAGLELDPVIGTDEVEAFKPDRRVYAAAVEATKLAPGQVVLISAHWWDALGAKRAGLEAAWIARREVVRTEVDPRPDYEAEGLAGAARRIITA